MNSIGARSNSGEGGESDDRINDPQRYSRIKRLRPPARRDLRLPSCARHRFADHQARPGPPKPGEVWPPAWSQRSRRGSPRSVTPPGRGALSTRRRSTPSLPIEDLEAADQRCEDDQPRRGTYPRRAWFPSLASAYFIAVVWPGAADVLISRLMTAVRVQPAPTPSKHAGTPWEIGLSETQPDADPERPALPHRRPVRRRAQDRS